MFRLQVILISGPPGSGKSTFLANWVKEFLKSRMPASSVRTEPNRPQVKKATPHDRIQDKISNVEWQQTNASFYDPLEGSKTAFLFHSFGTEALPQMDSIEGLAYRLLLLLQSKGLAPPPRFRANIWESQDPPVGSGYAPPMYEDGG